MADDLTWVAPDGTYKYDYTNVAAPPGLGEAHPVVGTSARIGPPGAGVAEVLDPAMDAVLNPARAERLLASEAGLPNLAAAERVLASAVGPANLAAGHPPETFGLPATNLESVPPNRDVEPLAAASPRRQPSGPDDHTAREVTSAAAAAHLE
jgi:hypothetical protein